MEERLLKLISLGKTGHRMLPIDETETTDYQLRGKKVLERRLIDDGRTLANWKPLTPYANLSLKKAPEENAEETVCFTAKSNLDSWLPGRGLGRIYSEPGAMRVLDHEDLTGWNRISVWIFPHVPGMKSLCVRVQLYNEGGHPVPDKYMREGAHNVNLKADQWNHVTCEIPNLHRNDVVGIAIEYDMCGHEVDSADTNEYYIKDLEIQKVEAQTETGWIPMDGVIAFSGSGYLPESEKLAIANMNLRADAFRIIETETGKCVFTGGVKVVNGLKVMDFTPLTQEGRYILLAGENSTRAFDISPRAFEASAWKLMNFYLSQRCGFEVLGKHRACHADLLLKHPDGRAIVANGGWHDAADLAQGMNNTADGTIGLLRLSERLKGGQGARGMLYERVLEEAKWGLDYVLKVRFGDGYRSSYSSLSIWTDGIIGTNDDIISHPTTNPFTNFVSACAEALGAYVFRDIDPVFSRYALKIAKEDFR
ncbi:MAG: glycoside hydrolase family 9 protein, partial [Clostridia bacterium]|nr:glycoside hydrolase family 9 protein [Clostridia bacterium]